MFHHYSQSFYWDTFDHFSLLKKSEYKLFTRVLRTRAISERHVLGHEFAPLMGHTNDHHKNGTNYIPA